MSWQVEVKKQNGSKESFDQKKLGLSIFKAAQRAGGKNRKLADLLAEKTVDYLKKKFPRRKVIFVEEIGSAVEKVLIEESHAKTAKFFILYREGQKRARKKLIKFKDLPKLREFLSLTDRRIAFVTGIYDLLHIGHARYLKKASLQGDVLVVGLNSDESAKGLKRYARPILGEEMRAEMLSHLDFINFIVIFPQSHAAKAIRVLKPDVYICVKGSWKGNFEEKAEVKAVNRYKGQIVVFSPQSVAVSTTKIIQRIKNNSGWFENE